VCSSDLWWPRGSGFALACCAWWTALPAPKAALTWPPATVLMPAAGLTLHRRVPHCPARQLTNFIAQQRPAPLRGGILADDMGLGKTLEVNR